MDMLRCVCFVYTMLLCYPVNGSKLFMMLIDGFRWDYFHLPGLSLRGFPRLFKEGVKAEYMIPDFPTNSFPNYKTIETGLHVENHGFVGNYMYNDNKSHSFDLELENPESFESHWWNDAEPFYITAEKQNIKTSLYYWRGCQVVHKGWEPTFCLPHSGPPTRDNIQWAIKDGIKKIQQDETDIVYIYHEEVDASGHFHGPTSQEVTEAVQSIDNEIDALLDVFDDANMHDVDLIIVSDHGMTTIDKLHMVNLSQAIDMDDIKEIIEGGSQAYIWPKEGREEKVYSSLVSLSSHIRVYNRKDIKDRWFFKNHKLVPPIFVNAEPGWFLVHPKSGDRYNKGQAGFLHGNHGFDNNLEDMRSIFVAKGPAFKKSFIAEPFSNVNVYQMICHVTGISPRPNNGTWNEVKDMFVHTSSHVEL